MGLFGGFKAKFTRNSTTKTKPQEVVCLRYHIQSEFDSQDPPIPVTNNIKKNEVIRRPSRTKVRKPLAKSAIFQDSDTSNTSLSSPAPQKSQSLVNLNGHDDQFDAIAVSPTLEMPGNTKNVAVTNTKFARKTEEHNGVVAETVAVVTKNHSVSSNDRTKTEKREKTVLKTFSAHNGLKEENGHRNLDGEQSTLIFMTQHSSETTERNADSDINFSALSNRSFKMTTKASAIQEDREDDYADGNFAINFMPTQSAAENNDEDDYKVNVVQHDYNRSYSYSEDEKSIDEEPLEFTKMGFSSQAASIFFGQDIEPIQSRPRRIMLKDDDEDDRRSSGADC